jgi:hypothetical protein
MTLTNDDVTFAVSGSAMSSMEGSELVQRPHLYNGEDSGIRAGKALQQATRRRAGKGWSYQVTCDREAAEEIRIFCEDVGSAFAGQAGYGEDETRAEGRALLKVADRIARVLATDG